MAEAWRQLCPQQEGGRQPSSELSKQPEELGANSFLFKPKEKNHTNDIFPSEKVKGQRQNFFLKRQLLPGAESILHFL